MSYNTEKRHLLIEFFKINSQKAYTVDEICNAVIPQANCKSTIYRLVAKLCDEGMLRKLLDEESGKVTYQYLGNVSCHEHFHLKCKDCGRLIHLDDRVSRALLDGLIANQGFELDSGAMLFGKCQSCRGGSSS